MKYSLRATSIIESMIVLLIIVTGITWVYVLLNSSQKLAASTGNRIEAIQIARDGLESFTNIRDTNWLLYSADYKNCWNVENHANCIGVSGTTNDINVSSNEWYTIYKNANNRFELSKYSGAWSSRDYADSTYKDNFSVFRDTNGFYTQTGTLNINKFAITPVYTRELFIEYIDTDWVWGANSDDEKLQISSIVYWSDSSTSRPQKVELSTILTNWKAKK